MNTEIKKKWIEALKSGKYQQIKGDLKTENGFCCLGVLCDIIDNSKWVYNPFLKKFLHEKMGQFPSPHILRDNSISFEDDDIVFKLARMNDIDNMNFNEIAKWIEENL